MAESYRMAVDHAAIFSETNPAGTIIHVNDMFCSISGYDRQELIGQNHRILNSGFHPREFFVEMWRTISSGHTWKGEICNRAKNGEIYWVHSVIVPMVDRETGRVYTYASIRFDITEKKKLVEDLQWRAFHDVLTGLPNRALLAERAKESCKASMSSCRSVAVGVLDLDFFKEINDKYGHAVGDQLLVVVANRLKSVVRSKDLISRVGGDEFVLILENILDDADLNSTLIRIMSAVSAPCRINDLDFRISASVGFTVYPRDDSDVDALLRHADQAMYIAKQKGPGSYHVFDVDGNSKIRAGYQIIGQVRDALGEGALFLHYQPKVSLIDGSIVGFEALLRWQDPERGLIPPLEFLPLIEQDDVISEVGEWAIDVAAAQIRGWSAEGRDWSISVNIAARHFKSRNFIERLQAVLHRGGLVSPGLLDIEIVESVALDNVDYVGECIEGCRALGVTFSLDDFGTGYSSLSYLKRLPTQTLKIDQTFIRNMLVDSGDLAITEAVIGLAKAFGRNVVAEGVETEKHCMRLKQLGCELVQGYLIAKPMPANEIPQWEAQYLQSSLYLSLINETGAKAARR